MRYAIIGAGIIGNAIAREISKRNIGEVIVLEKESDCAMHASGRNSGVIHSGINQRPGTMKAQLCLEGSRLLRDYCIEKNISMEECGTLIVALTEKEKIDLENLLVMAKKVGVPGVKIISRSELREREPFAIGLEALLSPTGAVVNPKSLVKSLQTDAESFGTEYQFNTIVKGISPNTITTTKKDFRADFIINCAGLQADEIAHMMGVGLNYSVIPFRGEYVSVSAKLNSMIYQVPDLRYPFLGVHLTKSTDGKILAGPTATISLGGKEDYTKNYNFKELSKILKQTGFIPWATRTLIDPSSLNQIVYNLRLSHSPNFLAKEIEKIYLGNINPCDMYIHPAGIRAQLVDSKGKLVNDFCIEKTPNSLHILNAVSPGMTASLAFAKHITDNYLINL